MELLTKSPPPNSLENSYYKIIFNVIYFYMFSLSSISIHPNSHQTFLSCILNYLLSALSAQAELGQGPASAESVSKVIKFNIFNVEHSENIKGIFATLLILNLLRFNFFND